MCQFINLHQNNAKGYMCACKSHQPYAATDVFQMLTYNSTVVSDRSKRYQCSLGLSGLNLIL